MLTVKRIFIVVLILILGHTIILFSAEKPKKVPFLSERHKVIIPTSVNGSPPLKLILDTGMRFDGVFMFSTKLVNLIGTDDVIKVQVPGAGGGKPTESMMIESGILKFGDIIVDSQKVIISQSEHTQELPTDGVIGWNLFGHYIVEIDYDNEIITLHDSAYVPQDTSWTKIPIELKKDIPWVTLEMEVVKNENVSLNCYIDLASSDVLELLTKESQKFTLPDSLVESHLGTGLSGDIYGHTGLSAKAFIGGFELSDLPTSFAPAEIRSKQDNADGILGNGFMEKFNVIFDYYNLYLFIKPNKSFSEKFDRN